jgi:RNA polymerase sigma-70 factor (ECF subfamily)
MFLMFNQYTIKMKNEATTTETINLEEVTKKFNQIYKEYHSQVLNFVTLILNNRTDAEDVTEMAFVNTWQAMTGQRGGNFNPEKSNIKTFLFNVAKREAIDFHRTAHKDKYMSVSDFQDAETGLEVFQFVDETADSNDSQELKQTIKKAVSGLKPKYRMLAKMVFYQQLSYNEIAIAMDVPLGTVQGMIFRVRKMLQDSLKEYATA